MNGMNADTTIVLYCVVLYMHATMWLYLYSDTAPSNIETKYHNTGIS